MAINKETVFSRYFAKKFLEGCHPIRVECLCSSGVPDLNACIFGVNVWIEFKQGTPKLRPTQVVFINRRLKVGGEVLVITRKNKSIEVYINPTDVSKSGIIQSAPDFTFNQSENKETFKLWFKQHCLQKKN